MHQLYEILILFSILCSIEIVLFDDGQTDVEHQMWKVRGLLHINSQDFEKVLFFILTFQSELGKRQIFEESCLMGNKLLK